MDCVGTDKRSVEILLDYCAGTLSQDLVSGFECHLDHCENCRVQVSLQKELWSQLDQDALNPIEPSPDFDARLYARIAHEDAHPLSRRWRVLKNWWGELFAPHELVSWRPVVPVAAAALVFGVAIYVRTPQPAPVQSEPARMSEQVEAVDLSQVEQTLEDLDILSSMSSSAPDAKM